MRTRTAALGVAMTLLVAACGGSSESADDEPTIIIEGATEQAAPATTAEVEADTTADDSATDESAGDDSSTGESAGEVETAEMTDEEIGLEFAQCMRDQGLDFEDPTVESDGSLTFTPPEGGVDDAFTDAFDECEPLLDGASFLPGDDQLTEIEDQLLEFAQCLRDEGLDVDDPDLSGGLARAAQGGIFGPDFDPDDPANADAIAACQGLLAGLAPGRA